MPASSPSLTARVSRRDLSHNRWTWLATGGMGVMIALFTLGIAIVEGGPDAPQQYGFAAFYGTVAFVLLRRQPPDIDEPFNHVVLAYATSATIAGLWVFQPGGGAAIGAGMFVGPLIAVRLQDRRLIALHLGVATAGLVSLAVAGILFGVVDSTTVIGIAVMTPAMWVLGACCTVILEASEAQGEELERLVRRDPLTGVGNRRLLDEQLAEHLRRHARSGQELSILALDLNGFKALNDTLGHAAGDELLRDTASALVRAARPQDVVVRQGGDEFCVVLPQTSRAHAERTANAIRANLAGTDTGGLVTTGIGIATFPEDALTADVLLHVADERLIGDKMTGPGRAVRHQAAPAPAPTGPPTDRREGDRREAAAPDDATTATGEARLRHRP